MSEVVCHIVEETLSFSVVEETLSFSVVEEAFTFSLEASCYSPEDMQDILDISFDLGYF